MRIGFAQMGRALDLRGPDQWRHTGSESYPYRLLSELATRHPDVTFEIVGRTAQHGENDLPSNVVDRWQNEIDLGAIDTPGSDRSVGALRRFEDTLMEETDGLIDGGFDNLMVLIGMSCSVLSMVPKLDGSGPVKPLQVHMDSSFLTRGINRWRDERGPLDHEEVWLQPDASYRVAMRDLKWPLRRPILSQYDYTKNRLVYRWGDESPPSEHGFGDVAQPTERKAGKDYWKTTETYVHANLELLSTYWLRDEPVSLGEGFGVAANRHTGPLSEDRFNAIRDWVAPIDGAQLYGKWHPEIRDMFDNEVRPLMYTEYLEWVRELRSTLTMPSYGWPTPRTYENFALGVVSFVIPGYDDQGHIIPTLDQDVPEGDEGKLYRFLRPETPEVLAHRVRLVDRNEDFAQRVIDLQRAIYERALQDRNPINRIEKRLGLT